MKHPTRKAMIDAARSLSIMLTNARMGRIPPPETIEIHKKHLTNLANLIESEDTKLKPFEWED